MKIPLLISAGALAILILGVAIPKLTVHDLVPVEPFLERCAESAVDEHYENPLERLALRLGKSRITATEINRVDVESFTIFRIPLGLLRGQPDLKLSVFCDRIGNPGAIDATDIQAE